MAYNPFAGIYQAQPNPGASAPSAGISDWLTNLFRTNPFRNQRGFRRNPFQFGVDPGSVTQGVNQAQNPQPVVPQSPATGFVGGRYGSQKQNPMTTDVGVPTQPGPVPALNEIQLQALMPLIQQQASGILANDPSKVNAWQQLRNMFPGLGSQNSLLQQLIPGLQFQQGAPQGPAGYKYVKSGRTSTKGLPIYQKVPA